MQLVHCQIDASTELIYNVILVGCVAAKHAVYNRHSRESSIVG